MSGEGTGRGHLDEHFTGTGLAPDIFTVCAVDAGVHAATLPYLPHASVATCRKGEPVTSTALRADT